MGILKDHLLLMPRLKSLYSTLHPEREGFPYPFEEDKDSLYPGYTI